MRVPLSWLKAFTPLPTDARDRVSVRELGQALDSLGLVVEGVEHVGEGLEEVVLARVLEIHPIEGADRIREVIVDAGDPDPARIVCGAMNFAVGDVVPLARIGAELPSGMTIGRRKMRGVTSEGMLCSAQELELGGDSSGLFVVASTGAGDAELPADLELGAALVEYLGIVPDAVFDLAIEPNRPDCLSIIGVARDLAARLRLPFDVTVGSSARAGRPAHEHASLVVEAPDACRHMLARVITGVTVGASTQVVTRRLLLSGMRPINSVVDASNYVMLELGQPTHPYDLETLGGGGLAVRFARPGERLVTLDGVERTLGSHTDLRGRVTEVEDLLICDADDAPVGLAGIMGGAATEIREATSRVLLEAAEFAPLVVARTAKRQGLRSEASVRFERGVDPEGIERAVDRFVELLGEAVRHVGIEAPVVAPDDLDVRPRPSAPIRLELRVARTNALLGTSLDAGQITSLLEPIGFRTESLGAEGADVPALAVVVPSFRPDVAREVDLIEEVARHHGYERIERTHRRSPYVGSLGQRNLLGRRLRQLLSGLGADEAWTSSVVDPTVVSRIGADLAVVELANPMVREESVLRASLLPGLLGALRTNVGHRNPSVRLFEIGRVFSPAPAGEPLPLEAEHVGLLLGFDGDDTAAATRAWRAIAEGLLLEPDAVSLEQSILGEVAGAGSSHLGALGLGLHPSRSGLLRFATVGANEIFGAVGEVDPDVLAAFSLPSDRRVGWIVLDVDQLERIPRRQRRARPVSRFPSSDIDLAFVLGDETAAAALESLLVRTAGELGESVRLLDVYRGPGVTPGARSLAYRIRFCALDRTLTDAEVAELRVRCIEAAGSSLSAVLRA